MFHEEAGNGFSKWIVEMIRLDVFAGRIGKQCQQEAWLRLYLCGPTPLITRLKTHLKGF